jgi:hypothetical protein
LLHPCQVLCRIERDSNRGAGESNSAWQDFAILG